MTWSSLSSLTQLSHRVSRVTPRVYRKRWNPLGTSQQQWFNIVYCTSLETPKGLSTSGFRFGVESSVEGWTFETDS